MSTHPFTKPAQASKPGAIFITYNGLLDPLGPSQILPYLERLHSEWPITILSFERPDRLRDEDAVRRMRERVGARGIGWTFLRYHKWPSLAASTFDLVSGIVAVHRIIAERRIGLLHARGYLPMAIAQRSLTKLPILFDIRGLLPEEYVDGGIWREGELKWRLAKASERRFFKRAGAAVVLTSAIKPHVQGRFAEFGRTPPVEVIPCCVDLERFTQDDSQRVSVRAKLGLSDETLLFVYSGSLGTWYLPKEMAAFVRVFRERTKRDAKLLWMVNNDQKMAWEATSASGLSKEDVRVVSADSGEVAGYLSAADAALALVRPSFSKKSSSPTKYAECLAMGLPLVISREVGDGRELETAGAAVALSRFDDAEYSDAAGAVAGLLEKPRSFFRQVARAFYDVDRVATPAYTRLYAYLLQ